MMVLYRCCFCRNPYEWYNGLHENPNYDHAAHVLASRRKESYPEQPGVFIRGNGLALKFLSPVDEEGLIEESLDSPLDCMINVCPDCMRKILDNLYCYNQNRNAWDSV